MTDIRITLQYAREGVTNFSTAHFPVEEGETVEAAIDRLEELYAPEDDEEWYTFKRPGTNGYDTSSTLVHVDSILNISFKPVSGRG